MVTMEMHEILRKRRSEYLNYLSEETTINDAFKVWDILSGDEKFDLKNVWNKLPNKSHESGLLKYIKSVDEFKMFLDECYEKLNKKLKG